MDTLINVGLYELQVEEESVLETLSKMEFKEIGCVCWLDLTGTGYDLMVVCCEYG
jgi:hypothetical protein